MIRIVCRMVVKKDCVAKFQELAKELVDETRKETGCIIYQLNQSIQDPGIHCFSEDWKDQTAIDAHNTSAHFQRILPLLLPLLEQPPQLDLFQIKF